MLYIPVTFQGSLAYSLTPMAKEVESDALKAFSEGSQGLLEGSAGFLWGWDMEVFPEV